MNKNKVLLTWNLTSP